MGFNCDLNSFHSEIRIIFIVDLWYITAQRPQRTDLLRTDSHWHTGISYNAAAFVFFLWAMCEFHQRAVFCLHGTEFPCFVHRLLPFYLFFQVCFFVPHPACLSSTPLESCWQNIYELCSVGRCQFYEFQSELLKNLLPLILTLLLLHTRANTHNGVS